MGRAREARKEMTARQYERLRKYELLEITEALHQANAELSQRNQHLQEQVTELTNLRVKQRHALRELGEDIIRILEENQRLLAKQEQLSHLASTPHFSQEILLWLSRLWSTR